MQSERVTYVSCLYVQSQTANSLLSLSWVEDGGKSQILAIGTLMKRSLLIWLKLIKSTIQLLASSFPWGRHPQYLLTRGHSHSSSPSASKCLIWLRMRFLSPTLYPMPRGEVWLSQISSPVPLSLFFYSKGKKFSQYKSPHLFIPQEMAIHMP